METVFWTRLIELCKQHNTTPTGVCKAVGLSTGSPPGWKRGRLPSMAVLNKIADYFQVEPQYFISETEKSPDAEATGAKKDLRYALFDGAEVSDETFEKVMAFARFALEEERRQKGE